MQKLTNSLVASAAFWAVALLVIPPVEAQNNQPSAAPGWSSTTVEHSATSTSHANAAGQTTTTQSTSTTVSRTDAAPALRPVVQTQQLEPVSASVVQKKKVKHKRYDYRTAHAMAKYHWLDKVAEADPGVVASICHHYWAALTLAQHPRLGEIAQWDHYTCRRLTKWKTVARMLARNGECAKVVAYDPEGIYRAIKRDKTLARMLSTNPQFDQMISENPDLGVLIAQYM
jgi:hypothetical protein